MGASILNNNSGSNEQVLTRRDKIAIVSSTNECDVTGENGIVQAVNGKLIASEVLDLGASE